MNLWESKELLEVVALLLGEHSPQIEDSILHSRVERLAKRKLQQKQQQKEQDNDYSKR